MNFPLSLAGTVRRHTEVRKWKNPPVPKPKATDWEEILSRTKTLDSLTDIRVTSFLRALLNHKRSVTVKMKKSLEAVS